MDSISRSAVRSLQERDGFIGVKRMQCRLSLGIVKTLKESKQTWKLN
jgi:hypothetical protein